MKTTQATTSKPIFRSKTAAFQVFSNLIVMMIPSLQSWISSNVVMSMLILGAVNIGLRMITNTKVSLFPQSSSNLLGALFFLCALGATSAVFLVSCRHTLPIQGRVFYARDHSELGVVYSDGRGHAYGRHAYVDADGNVIGEGEISVPLFPSPSVEAAK